MENTLYGTCSNNCCAYCKRHGTYLTVKQMRGRECLGKQCRHLDKIETHEYWEQRNRTKQKRKARKMEIEKKIGRDNNE